MANVSLRKSVSNVACGVVCNASREPRQRHKISARRAHSKRQTAHTTSSIAQSNNRKTRTSVYLTVLERASSECALRRCCAKRAKMNERPRSDHDVLLPHTSRHRQLARATRRRTIYATAHLLFCSIVVGQARTFRSALCAGQNCSTSSVQANNVYHLNFLCTPADVGQEENRRRYALCARLRRSLSLCLPATAICCSSAVYALPNSSLHSIYCVSARQVNCCDERFRPARGSPCGAALRC